MPVILLELLEKVLIWPPRLCQMDQGRLEKRVGQALGFLRNNGEKLVINLNDVSMKSCLSIETRTI
jgi:hypothetical protein